jgi:phosphoribosylanthranilate isomerase
VVGVFRDHTAQEINAIAQTAGLDLVQLHGGEPDEIVRDLELPVIKALCVTDVLPDIRTSASWLMFDTGGGTGRTFDWSLLESYPRTTPFFLAGGLTPDNVADAIRIARPDAIDLSSGVESAPGIKNPHKMKRLFARVRP